MATKKYIVMCDAVVVTTGKKSNGRPEYTRVLRGGLINGNPESETIKDLVRKGAIEQATSAEHAAELRQPERRQTVKMAAQRMGAPDDPVAEAYEGILPVAAPNPVLDPDTLLASDLDTLAEA